MYLPYEYIEKEKFESGFAEYYAKHVVPVGKKHNTERKKRQFFHIVNIVKALTTGIGTSVLIAKSAWFAKVASSGNKKSGNILLLPPIFCWWFFVHRPRRRYFQALKEDIVPIILKFFGEFKYSVSGDIKDKILSTHTGYFSTFKLISCEDFISYKTENLNCTILERTVWDIKNKPPGQVFIYIKSKHSFDIDAVIISKLREKNFRYTDKRLLKKRNIHRTVEITDKTIMNSFDIHANNSQINKWMSRKFIKDLNALNNTYDEEGFLFSIKDNEIFIELASKGNFFEIGTDYNSPVANVEDIRNFLLELTTTMQLVTTISETITNDKVEAIKEEQNEPPPSNGDKKPILPPKKNTRYKNEITTWHGRT